MKSWTAYFWPALVAAFLVGEGVALLDGSKATQPFTNWTIQHVGAELTLTVLLWAALHFGIRYWRKGA